MVVTFKLKSSICHRSNVGIFCVTKSVRSAKSRVWAISRTAGSMPESGSTLSRLKTLSTRAVVAFLSFAIPEVKLTARAASTLSGSGFSRRHCAIAACSSACCSSLSTLPASSQISFSALEQISSKGRAGSPKILGSQYSSSAIRVTVTKTVMSSRLAIAFGPETIEQFSVTSAIFDCSTSARVRALDPVWSLSTPMPVRVEKSSAKRSSFCWISTGSAWPLSFWPGVTARTVWAGTSTAVCSRRQPHPRHARVTPSTATSNRPPCVRASVKEGIGSDLVFKKQFY